MSGNGARSSTESPLERYVRILELVSGFPDGISATDVGAALGLPKATAHRLMRNLAEVQAVAPVAQGVTHYRLGERLDRLLFAGAGDEWLRAVARPVLQDLAADTGQACFVAALRGEAVRSIEMVAPDDLVRAYIMPGQEIPVHAGASAKAILALQESGMIDRLLARPMRRFTARTRMSAAVVKKELADVRRDGIAYCVGEDVEGFAAIAAPVIVEGFPSQHSVCLTGTEAALMGGHRERNEGCVRTAATRLSELLSLRLRRSNTSQDHAGRAQGDTVG